MEYTITLPDSPCAIACGSDGSFLNPFGELESEPLVAPQFSMGSPARDYTQGAEGKSSACPHRQVCYQTLSEWYIRHGKNQRPDVTSHDRLDIAQRFHDPERPWGEVIGMAREYNLSRTMIYDIAGRLVETLVNEKRQSGIHQVRWNRKSNPSGVYFYRLKAGEFVATKKMVVVD